jgi:DNA-binding Lrp family transcriptional regulator
MLRTGRGFLDLTDKALKEIGKAGEEAFVMVTVEPNRREEVTEKVKSLGFERLYRVTGEVDLVAVVDVESLKEFLRDVSSIPGVTGTSSHVVIEMFQEM